MDQAERLFGPRERDWTPIGIEFFGNRPHVWFPGDRKHALIRLSDTACDDSNQALFQLAHEVVHLLSPIEYGKAPNMEEGAATFFCDSVSIQHGLAYHTTDAAYLATKRMVEELLAIDDKAIIKLRAIEPKFYKITPELVRQIVPSVPLKLAEDLCEPATV